MTRNDEAGKVLLYVITGIALVVGVLVAIAWVTRTPLYTLQAWLASPCDRDLTIAAAAKVVAQNEAKIKRFLEAPIDQ